MHIKGGLNGQRGNPNDPNDEGVFISKINSGGAARRDARLKVTNFLFNLTKQYYITPLFSKFKRRVFYTYCNKK